MTPAAELLAVEQHSPALFAAAHATAWGVCYTDPNNTASPDANHAVVTDPAAVPAAVLAQTRAFYEARGIPPRLRLFLAPDRLPAWQAAAAQAGGTLTVSPARLLVWQGAAPALPPTPLTIDRETVFDPAARETLLPEHPQLEGPLCRCLNHGDFHLLVGRLFGTPAAMAAWWETPAAVRVSHVLTGPGFRGCGFATVLMRRLQAQTAPLQKPVFLLADDPAALRLYARQGFADATGDVRPVMWQI